jgi:hypothetical protein
VVAEPADVPHAAHAMMKRSCSLLQLLCSLHDGTRLFMQKHISRLVQLTGKGLQSSGLIGVLVKGMRDACLSVPPAYISACVKKLTHPSAR